MSIIYCDKHNHQWDSDFMSECPFCEGENLPDSIKEVCLTLRSDCAYQRRCDYTLADKIEKAFTSADVSISDGAVTRAATDITTLIDKENYLPGRRLESIEAIIRKHLKSAPEPSVAAEAETLKHVHITDKQAVITGGPTDFNENDPRFHNCDAMGCPTLDHVLYRLPFTDHRKPVDVKDLARTLAESIDFTAGPVQARKAFEKWLDVLVIPAAPAHPGIVPGWVKCSERMPTQEEQLYNGVLALVHYPAEPDLDDKDSDLIYLAHYKADGVWYSVPDDETLLSMIPGIFDGAVVTHWMPLPAAPKGQP